MMKVLIRFGCKVNVVENIGVDDKCLPLVGGIPPYHIPTKNTSPLVLESALWFKTLAIEAVYIDCNQRLIYWTPIVRDVNTPDEYVHTQVELAATPDTTDCIPSTARPLFKDNSVYDFDASLKEMMGKCCEMSRKLSNKSLSTDEYHKNIAKMLHIYILPSITFTRNDIFCLSQAKSQITICLSKAESNIKHSAVVTENLKSCLNKMASKLLDGENMDNESYLRNCRRDFLVAFLKVVEIDIDNLNIELSSAQNKVNWFREHPDGAHRLSDLKVRRDKLFLEIDKRITVREAIKNVIFRRELTKRKVTRCRIINNSIHNVFVEVAKKLEIEDLILCRLGNDKVNICAAREAVLCTISDINNSHQNSDLATLFEPKMFADYSVVEGKKVEKSDVWLTFQERVAKILKDKLSMACMCHEIGCRNLSSEIYHILSELPIDKREPQSFIQLQESFDAYDSSGQFSLSLNDVIMRTETLNLNRKDSVLSDESLDSYCLQQITNMYTGEAADTQFFIDTDEGLNCIDNRSTSSASVILHDSQEEVTGREFWSSEDVSTLHNRRTLTYVDGILADENLLPTIEQVKFGNAAIFRKNESPQEEQQCLLKQLLTLSTVMDTIENLKSQIQTHFADVIDCLDHQLLKEDSYEASFHEQQELLWKSYERFFCQELYLPLLKLYMAGLAPSIRQAYSSLSKIPLQEILKEDKLLDLFFGQSIFHSKTAPIKIVHHGLSRGKISGVQPSLCFDVRDCEINDLYSSLNIDNDHPYSFDCDEIGANASSCNSSLSAMLSIDEGFYASSGSFSSSAQSVFSVDSLDRDDWGKWKTMPNPEKVEEILCPVLSPFRMHIRKCLDATCFLDKVRYITKAIEGLNADISRLIGPGFEAACDDIISMLVLALSNISEDMFVELYVNLRLLMDVLPSFLNGSMWDYNLVSFCASYDYLFSLKMSEHGVKRSPGDAWRYREAIYHS